jgi:hypothetical protein
MKSNGWGFDCERTLGVCSLLWPSGRKPFRSYLLHTASSQKPWAGENCTSLAVCRTRASARIVPFLVSTAHQVVRRPDDKQCLVASWQIDSKSSTGAFERSLW